MKKKIIIGSLLAIMMLVTITFTTSISAETDTDETKESPLYEIRTDKANQNNVEELSTSYIGEDGEFTISTILISEDGEEINSWPTQLGDISCSPGGWFSCSFPWGCTADEDLCLTIRIACWESDVDVYYENLQ